jgi:hypothetical protein
MIGSENENELALDNVAGIRERTQRADLRSERNPNPKFEIRKSALGGAKTVESGRAEGGGKSETFGRADDWVRDPRRTAEPPSANCGGASATAGGRNVGLETDEFFYRLATGSRFLQIIVVERVFVVGCPVSILHQGTSTIERQVANTSFHRPPRACRPPALAPG